MTQTLAELFWVTAIVGWCVIRYPFERKSRKYRVSKSLFDGRERVLLAIGLVGLFVIPAWYIATGFPAAFDRPFVSPVGWSGLLVLILALWLFRRSHVDLGRNWSVTLQVREDHVLVTNGVYRLIRNPMYLSFLLLGLAQALLIPNWFVGVAGIMSAWILFSFRVAREEQMMLDQFGEAYRSYMAQTKRIIPWLI